MNKDEILNTLKKYNLKDFIIISGASMVIQGVKKTTNDIDIIVDDDTYNFLLDNCNCKLEKIVNGYKVWFIDEIINFSNNYFNKVDYIKYEEYKIQTLDSIRKLKLDLNRKKDRLDLKLIDDYKKNKV